MSKEHVRFHLQKLKNPIQKVQTDKGQLQCKLSILSETISWSARVNKSKKQFYVGIYIDSSLFPMSNHLYRHYTIEEIQSNCGDYQIILVMGRVRNYTKWNSEKIRINFRLGCKYSKTIIERYSHFTDYERKLRNKK